MKPSSLVQNLRRKNLLSKKEKKWLVALSLEYFKKKIDLKTSFLKFVGSVDIIIVLLMKHLHFLPLLRSIRSLVYGDLL